MVDELTDVAAVEQRVELVDDAAPEQPLDLDELAAVRRFVGVERKELLEAARLVRVAGDLGLALPGAALAEQAGLEPGELLLLLLPAAGETKRLLLRLLFPSKSDSSATSGGGSVSSVTTRS